MSNNYQGSQAFTQNSVGTESVNPNTGSVSFNKHLLSMRGPSKASGLALSLSFAQGAVGAYGLPDGWSLALPYVLKDGTEPASLTFGPSTYKVDLGWNNAFGIQTGLAYVNSKGIQFKYFQGGNTAPLSGHSAPYTYTNGDGSTWYFDPNGRLIERCNLFGVGMVVTYRDGQTTAENALIEQIQMMVKDGAQASAFGPALSFAPSGGNSLALRLNDTEIAAFQWDLSGVRTITEGGVLSARITPQTIHDQNTISTIEYWNGLKTTFEYQDIPYYDGSLETVKNFVAVKSQYHRGPNGALLGRTDYDFGGETGNTFTGYAQKLLIQQANDALIEAAFPTYTYPVKITRCDENGTALSRSEITYNTFHAPVTTDFYSHPADAAPSYRLSNTYDQIGKDALKARNFNLPVKKTISVLSETSDTTRITKSAQAFTYTDFGKVSQKTVTFGDSDAIIAQENHSYQETPDGRAMVTDSFFYDGVLQQTTHSRYSLNDAQSAVLEVIRGWADGGPFANRDDAAWQGWKKTAMTYDALGRLATRTLSWADDYSGDKGAVASAQVSHNYALNGASLTVTLTNALGASTQSEYDLSLPSGPLTAFQDADGNKTTYQFDPTGRLLSSTDPNGVTVQYTYQRAGVGATGDAVNTITSTNSATAYQTVCFLDALDRSVSLYDNGTGTQTLSKTADRPLRKQGYDLLGNLAERVDELGRKTTYTYDGLGRMLSKTLPDQSVATITYNDEAGASLTSINGVVQSVHRADPLGRPLGTEVYPEIGPSSTMAPLSHQSSYSGFGKVLSRSALTLPVGTAGTATPPAGTLQSVSTFTYDLDGKPLTITQHGHDANDGQSYQQMTHDLLGNVTAITRKVTDAQGTETTATSSTHTFDAAGALNTIDQGVGGIEHRDHTAAGRLSTLTLPNSAFQYGYQGGVLSRVDLLGADGKPCGPFVSYDRDSAQNLTAMATESDKMGYEYTPDGALWSVSYPENGTLTLELDKTSRITGATDLNGVKTTCTYDDLGRLSTRSQNGSTLTFQYDATTQRLSTIAISGPQAGTLAFSYDDFGRPAGSSLKTDGGTALLDVQATRDWSSRLRSVTLTSAAFPKDPSINSTLAYDYDVLGRMIQQTVTPHPTTDSQDGAQSVSFGYDAAGNLLSEQSGADSQTFTYNSFNQRQGGPVYDANGRMTDDGKGTTYSFDAWDRLTSMTTAEGKTDFAYWPDGSLKSVSSPSSAQDACETFAYLGGAVSSSRRGGQTSSLLRGVGTAMVRIEKDSGQATLLGAVNGSTCLAYDGKQGQTASYSAFGQASTALPESTLTWKQGLQLGGSNLSYLRARWHAPELRSFISADPTLQLNRYAFSNGDPCNYADPTGLMPAWADTLIMVGLMVGLDIITDGAATALTGEETEALAEEDANVSAQNVADRRELSSSEKTLSKLKSLRGSSEAIDRSIAGLENEIDQGEQLIEQRTQALNDRISSLKNSRRYKLARLLKYKRVMAPVLSVSEDALHRLIKGEPFDMEALESFGLDIVLSSVFAGFGSAESVNAKTGLVEVEASLSKVVSHTISHLPGALTKMLISSAVHRQFGLGGLSYIPRLAIAAQAFGGETASANQGSRLEETLGSLTVPVSLSNAQASAQLGGALISGPQASPFATLSAAGEINNAQTLAHSLQRSIFATGRALHAAQ